MDLTAFARLIERQRIDACMTMPNFQNPTGSVMPDAKKKEFARLITQHRIPVIENGVYNELHHGDSPPGTIKAYDTEGLVLHCSSFSKTLSAGARIGWALPGRYRQQVERLKFLNTLATPTVPQRAIAEYMARDGMDQHPRGMRKALAQRAGIMQGMVQRFFPAGTKACVPRGGYLMWIELPGAVDTMRIYREALARHITIAPGRVFSNANLFPNFMRLNYSHPWTAELEASVREVGAIAAWA